MSVVMSVVEPSPVFVGGDWLRGKHVRSRRQQWPTMEVDRKTLSAVAVWLRGGRAEASHTDSRSVVQGHDEVSASASFAR